MAGSGKVLDNFHLQVVPTNLDKSRASAGYA